MSDQPPKFAPLTNLPAFPQWEQYVGLWAIEESVLSTLWGQLHRMDLRAHMAQAAVKSDATVRREQRIGIVEIRGTMTKQGSSMSDAGSTVRIRHAIRQLAQDQSVDGIMIVAESGGGVVAGTEELNRDIAEATKAKPVLSFIEDMACSACYYAIAPSSKIVANTAHAWVGSIGTMIALYDSSAQAKNEGIRPVIVRTGSTKGVGVPGMEITSEMEEMLQSLADQTQQAFAAAVRSGRKLTATQMKEVETARVFSATAAQELGLIDGVMTYDAAVKELGRMAKERGKPKMSDASQNAADLPERRAATIAEIKAACQGADAGFVIGQAEAGHTLPQVMTAWGGIQSLKIEELTAKLEASEKAKTDLQSQLDLALKTRGSHAPVKEKPGQAASGSSEDAKATPAKIEVDRLVAELTAKSVDKIAAIDKVFTANPDLRQRMIDEANPK